VVAFQAELAESARAKDAALAQSLRTLQE
jgi:hypothetical protein